MERVKLNFIGGIIMIKRIKMVVVWMLCFIIVGSNFNVAMARDLNRSNYYDEQSYQVISQSGSIIYECAVEKFCIGDSHRLVWYWTSKEDMQGYLDAVLGVLQVYRVEEKEGKYFARPILRYEGGMSRTAPSSQGKIATVKLEDGSVIKGRFSEYTCNGSRTWPNGDVFIGTMDGINLQQGTMKYANGDIYVGRWGWNEARYIGEGSPRDGIIYMNDAYVGAWSFGEKYYHGKGKLSFADGTVYEGDFDKGKANGYGTFRWPNGDTYVGEWKDDQRTGKGKLTFKDGTVQEGRFIEDVFMGL